MHNFYICPFSYETELNTQPPSEGRQNRRVGFNISSSDSSAEMKCEFAILLLMLSYLSTAMIGIADAAGEGSRHVSSLWRLPLKQGSDPMEDSSAITSFLSRNKRGFRFGAGDRFSHGFGKRTDSSSSSPSSSSSSSSSGTSLSSSEDRFPLLMADYYKKK